MMKNNEQKHTERFGKRLSHMCQRCRLHEIYLFRLVISLQLIISKNQIYKVIVDWKK